MPDGRASHRLAGARPRALSQTAVTVPRMTLLRTFTDSE